MKTTERVALTALSGELKALTGVEVAPSYRKLWVMTVDGRLPATLVSGRYQVSRDDLPAICEMLGLRLKNAAPRAARASKREAASVTA